MDSFGGDDEEFQFFDAPEEIEQEFDGACEYENWEYDVWVRTPQSVGERRREFINMMGLPIPLGGKIVNKQLGDFDRIVENNGAVLRTSSSDLEVPSISSCNKDDRVNTRVVNLSEFRNLDGNSNFRNESVVVENHNLGNTKLRHLLSAEKFENSSRNLSPLEQIKQRPEVDCSPLRKTGKLKERWLRKWHSFTCIAHSNARADNMVADSFGQRSAPRVKVRHSRKNLKELSALFAVQDIQAHEGSILTMKFSPDGRFLASAGEDKIVTVWQVVEDERSNVVGIPDADPSCLYLSADNLSKLEPLVVETDKINKPKYLRRTLESACVIFPQKVFRILEKPLHVFRGHAGDVLDLSWSKDNCLLSASIDKTVRLWRVGVNQCLKVFKHNDYVTCIQFNPVYDDCFISGSIDGKVRIWTISGGQVVQWAEMRDIVTAVSYRPDGQSGIVGSITGTCRYFNTTDNNFELEADACLTNKKKSPCKRITGFQFFPQDPSKVLVTSADSHVKILHGTNVLMKYKGLRNAGNYMSATTTSDGKHIVSASDDSNVYLWNLGDPSFSSGKVTKSFEYFTSHSSIALPWPGLRSGALDDDAHLNSIPFWSSTPISLTHEYLLDSGSKVSATWPEEKLPASRTSPLSKSQYKLFKTSYDSSLKAHTWSLVIVTAGWDGHIRSFQNYGLPMPKSR